MKKIIKFISDNLLKIVLGIFGFLVFFTFLLPMFIQIGIEMWSAL
jgi:hypothetical protein